MSMSCSDAPGVGTRSVFHCATSLRLIRIADVDHVQRAGAVVGEVDVRAELLLAIDEGASARRP